ncbi:MULTISPECIES: M23 family metallopeptidase [Aeromicrobium]|uniref:M23 family metallopeptidase n=1 Tax=Aeromicrobium TaxID=2040 RepID=UPI00257BB866|nr:MULTISPECIES: M23 family metallopeptidase [Aeromicrobium]
MARRSAPTLLGYAFTQAQRVRGGAAAIAGNHVVIAMGDGGPFVLLAHLRQGSVRVAVGDEVVEGRAVGACGNSGNSTQPHVHLQVTDSIEWNVARGLPLAFRGPDGPTLPDESEIVSA